ncbi:riboflavin synthase [Candidatus Woesearchaeota archaeon CG10_big_fil_rev_8_21_14_0_10_45_16]|nr:MAG: riboflavin synthase [Candidatus Woesearchaeota archaeon CG10_big_fil_rev_8_21_14_0_10_45_16]
MKIGIADTMFARVDMAKTALQVIGNKHQVERYTVPGFKDLPVACKKLIEEYGCDIVIAFGWVGKEDIDEVCAHEANQGLIQAELMTNKHILKVFFHEKETRDEKKQKEIALDRAKKHTENALALLKGKSELTREAGQGKRQGYDDAGEIA